MIMIDETDEFAFLHLDEARIGTPLYEGKAFFWDWEYRHPMRELTCSMRKTIHDRFLRAGLALDECSLAHQRIIEKFCNRKDVKRHLANT